MGKQGTKDPVAKARKKVAQAQNRYMKAVAKGERQIRNVRAHVDEKIARAKAQFELRAGELADVEQHAEGTPNGATASPEKAADVVEMAATSTVQAEPAVVSPNGAQPKARPKAPRASAKSASAGRASKAPAARSKK
jgi:hypothetical protein